MAATSVFNFASDDESKQGCDCPAERCAKEACNGIGVADAQGNGTTPNPVSENRFAKQL